jgi:putative Ca2+/H+ antiporter (TMEM165/GDT1 family)
MIKIIISTFFIVFIAELGDKTQLATMIISSQSNSKVAVLLGSSIALICSSILGVLIGSILNKYIPPNIIQFASAIAFLVIGVLLLFHRL